MIMQDQYENERRILIQRLNDRETIEIARMRMQNEERGMGPIPALNLIIFGCVVGLIIMFIAQRCDREPMPTPYVVGSLDCSYCHAVRLDNAKRYSRYWKARRSVDQTKLVTAKDDSAEDERIMKLIMGGKP